MSPERPSSPLQEQPQKMSAPASPVAGTPVSDAESSIALLLAVAHGQTTRPSDDDLTSLSWLHEGDVLKGINLVTPSPSSSSTTTPVKPTTNANLLSDHLPTSDYVDDSSTSAADSLGSNSSLNSPNPSQSAQSTAGTKHPYHVPYDPMVHLTSKPPYSFSCLIFMAIEDSKQKALPVKEIYAWILGHFPYFKNAPTGWKNSVRHNLSLNKCFQKVEKAPNLGKGSLWTVDSQFRPNLLQALTRSPFHPCSTLDPTIYFSSGGRQLEKSQLSRTVWRTATLKKNEIKVEMSEESLDAVDAATVMLSLKNGPRFHDHRPQQIITSSPSEDHTYSASESFVVSPDEAFESDEERYVKRRICRKIDFNDEEYRKSKEGAETLLSLAGIITSRKRHNSQNYDYPHRRKKLDDDDDDEDDDEDYEKPTHFRPRLLRTKRREKIIANNHFNNNNNVEEWV